MKKRKDEADDFEKRGQRRDHEHAVKESCFLRQEDEIGDGKQKTGAGDSGAKSRAAFARQTDGENRQRSDDDDHFGRREIEKIAIIHFKNRIASTAGMMRSSSTLG